MVDFSTHTYLRMSITVPDTLLMCCSLPHTTHHIHLLILLLVCGTTGEIPSSKVFAQHC